MIVGGGMTGLMRELSNKAATIPEHIYKTPATRKLLRDGETSGQIASVRNRRRVAVRPSLYVISLRPVTWPI